LGGRQGIRASEAAGWSEGQGKKQIPRGNDRKKREGSRLPVGHGIVLRFGVNWRDENENVCGGRGVGGVGWNGWWAGGFGEEADDVCGFDGDEAGE
jgi:hypothetical protein